LYRALTVERICGTKLLKVSPNLINQSAGEVSKSSACVDKTHFELIRPLDKVIVNTETRQVYFEITLL
jgi:hypothetical protein